MNFEDQTDIDGMFDADDFAEAVVYTRSGQSPENVELILDYKAGEHNLLSARADAGEWIASVPAANIASGAPGVNDIFVAGRGTFTVTKATLDASGFIYDLKLKGPA